MNPLKVLRLISGGVITNYHCVSQCGHCLYNCGPHRARDYLDSSQAEQIFARIVDLNCPSVHIGGGEPLLKPAKLLKVLAVARRAGVGIDYVETNSAWYVDPEQARDVLGALLEAGVHTLLVSISPFHNAHIPLAKVLGVIDACHHCGMRVFPWIDGFVRDLSRMDQQSTHRMSDYEAVFGEAYLKHIAQRYWIHLGGRALQTYQTVYSQYSSERILRDSPSNCAGTLEDTTHFHIDLYGNYVPGLCSGLAIAMNDLGRKLEPGKYLLLDRLAGSGIRGLFEMASQDFGYNPQRGGFLNHCDLCTDIRNFLLQQDAHQFIELAPSEFYSEQISY